MDFVFVGFRGKLVRRSFSHILGVDSFSLFVPLNNFEKDLNLEFFLLRKCRYVANDVESRNNDGNYFCFVKIITARSQPGSCKPALWKLIGTRITINAIVISILIVVRLGLSSL